MPEMGGKQHLLGQFFDPEDGGNTFLQNIGELLPYMVSHSRG
jgi:hypothetical protein